MPANAAIGYTSLGVRAMLSFVGTMSTIMVKLAPELGISPEMTGMDSRAAATEWARVTPWKQAGMDEVSLRLVCAVWLWSTVYFTWRRPILGGAMWTWYFILADTTVMGVSKLEDANPNPNCPDGKPHCQEVFTIHCILGSLGLLVIALEYIKPMMSSSGRDVESKKVN